MIGLFKSLQKVVGEEVNDAATALAALQLIMPLQSKEMQAGEEEQASLLEDAITRLKGFIAAEIQEDHSGDDDSVTAIKIQKKKLNPPRKLKMESDLLYQNRIDTHFQMFSKVDQFDAGGSIIDAARAAIREGRSWQEFVLGVGRTPVSGEALEETALFDILRTRLELASPGDDIKAICARVTELNPTGPAARMRQVIRAEGQFGRPGSTGIALFPWIGKP